ncbi:DUF3850 domain-containing protein [Gelidibacter japonicus]|uniref:DUF3850 domain-containing protein n=1 Tax=Gelidibacter japonicus TaxID=1962232 RepID=UPI002AFF0360|nr:DUF3850 domain-containing protein [Gelidibacter japonicus]
MIHKIKIHEKDAKEHLRGVKPWELRKNDRNYQIGDDIEFTIVDAYNKPTGHIYTRRIIDVFHGGVYGLQNGFCIITLGLEKTDQYIRKQ